MVHGVELLFEEEAELDLFLMLLQVLLVLLVDLVALLLLLGLAPSQVIAQLPKVSRISLLLGLALLQLFNLCLVLKPQLVNML